MSLGAKEENLRWEEFGGDPERLVADYTVRLLSALVSMSKARSYILGEVRNEELCHVQIGSAAIFMLERRTPVVFQRGVRPQEAFDVSFPRFC